MRILFWLNIGLDKPSTSGHLLCDMIAQLVRRSHRVHIIQLDQSGPSGLPEQIRLSGVTTTRIPCRESEKNNFIRRYLNELRYCLDCVGELKRNADCDAVFIQSSNVMGAAVFLARRFLRRASVTINVQDIFPYNAAYSGHVKERSLAFKTLAAIQRYGYRHADRIITISEDMKALLMEDGTDGKKIDVIHNWSYQDEPYDRNSLDLTAVAHMFKPTHFNVVYAGNIGVMQNVDILIETAQLMRADEDIRFHIIGNGVYREKLEKRVETSGLTNVSFWPIQPASMAPVIYSAADVNVIPLVKNVYRTAFPSKTATCLACGQPIIFAIGRDSRLGQKLMQETGCLLTQSDDPMELAEAIKSIRREKKICSMDSVFRREFCRSINSNQYAYILTRID